MANERRNVSRSADQLLPEWQKEYTGVERMGAWLIGSLVFSLGLAVITRRVDVLCIFVCLSLYFYYILGRRRWLKYLSDIVINTLPQKIDVSLGKTLITGYIARVPRSGSTSQIMLVEKPKEELQQLFSEEKNVTSMVYFNKPNGEPLAIRLFLAGGLEQGIVRSKSSKAMRSCYRKLPRFHELLFPVELHDIELWPRMDEEKSEKMWAVCCYIPLVGATVPIFPCDFWYRLKKPSPFLKGHALQASILQLVFCPLLIITAFYQEIPLMVRYFILAILFLGYLILSITWMNQAYRGIAAALQRLTDSAR